MRPAAFSPAVALPSGRRPRVRARVAGFTLFEMLVVLAILSIVATIGVPSMLQALKKNPLRQAVSDLTDACQNARMMAILRGERTELIINSSERSLRVALAPERPAAAGADGSTAPPAGEGEGETRVSHEVEPFSAKLPEGVEFKKLVINLQDMMDAAEARVRFYPNGTCDAFVAHLLSEHNEERRITLEITTARESIEVVR